MVAEGCQKKIKKFTIKKKKWKYLHGRWLPKKKKSKYFLKKQTITLIKKNENTYMADGCQKKKKNIKKKITKIKEYENTYMAEGCQIQLK